LKAAGGKDGMNVPPAVVDEDSEIGRRYIAAMQLAGRYSYAGREWVVERVRLIIGGTVTDMVHTRWDTARLLAGHRRGCLARLATDASWSAWKDRHQRIRVTNFRPIGISLPSLRIATHPPAGTRFIADTCERRIIQDRWALTNWSGFSRLSMLVRVPDIRNDLVPTCRRT